MPALASAWTMSVFSCTEREPPVADSQNGLFIFVVIGDRTNHVRNQKRRTEPNAELSNHGHVTVFVVFMKIFGPNLVVVPRLFTRSSFVIPMPESSIVMADLVFFWDDFDEIWLGVDFFSIGDGSTFDIVQGIVRN